MENIFSDVIARCAQTQEEPGDYTGPDGLLYCGKCRTPKQLVLPFDPLNLSGSPTIVATSCRCQQEEEKRAELRDRRERFLAGMRRRWEDGISTRTALEHTFHDDDRQNPAISDACRNYVQQWDEMQADNIGVLFYGGIGTGKSFFASCIGRALLNRNVPVAATNFPRLLSLLHGSFDRQSILDRLAVYRLLILDDLGVERDSAYGLEQMFDVVDTRSRSRLPVIITTNLTPEELEHPGDMKYARIYDRILEMCPIRIRVAGESRRRPSAEERLRKSRALLR